MRQLKLILDEVDSTQTRLKAELAKDPNLLNLSFVQALTQKSGRGRHDNSWQSPEGNFYISILLRGPHADVTWMPLWIAICLKQAIESSFDLTEKIYLKWPNDLVVKPFAKISGVLCEKIGDHVVAGIGVNVRAAPAIKGREVSSVRKISSQNLDGSSLIRLKDALFAALERPLSVGQIRESFERGSLIKEGAEIEWLDTSTQKKSVGVSLGLGEHGELRITVDGKAQSLFSEEVTQVKKTHE